MNTFMTTFGLTWPFMILLGIVAGFFYLLIGALVQRLVIKLDEMLLNVPLLYRDAQAAPAPDIVLMGFLLVLWPLTTWVNLALVVYAVLASHPRWNPFYWFGRLAQFFLR